jgi:hypothetical protein
LQRVLGLICFTRALKSTYRQARVHSTQKRERS